MLNSELILDPSISSADIFVICLNKNNILPFDFRDENYFMIIRYVILLLLLLLMIILLRNGWIVCIIVIYPLLIICANIFVSIINLPSFEKLLFFII